MGVSIRKVAEEKLHKRNKPECEIATATMEAYIDERLCEEIRKDPQLYYFMLQLHKDIYMGFNSWRDIVQTLARRGIAIWRKVHASNVCVRVK